MSRKRAVEPGQSVDVKGRLPLLYKSLAPIVPENHANLYLAATRTYDAVRNVTAIPITCDEFAQVQQHYPIVFSPGKVPSPVALVGLEANKNEFVTEDGTWEEGCYVPAYLRRYPFILLQESADSDRQVLCADLSSTSFQNDPEGGLALFEEDGGSTETLTSMLDFCSRYELAMKRTKDFMSLMMEHDLLQDSVVTLNRGGRTSRVDGFSMIAEDKVRGLDDAVLADFARRGILSICAAHQFSMSNFSDLSSL